MENGEAMMAKQAGTPGAQGFSALAARRRSVRAFTSQEVDEALLHRLLRDARRAPSGANLQPGSLLWVRGAARERLSAALLDAARHGRQEQEDYGYFPRPLPAFLRRRQVEAAQALYGALGVARGDKAGRALQFERNFSFFDAPVALVATMDSGFGAGGYMDLGMMLYGLMLAAEDAGLASCAIGALASYPGVIRQALGLPPERFIVCGLALGYAAADAPVNATRTSRCSLEEFFAVIED